MTDATFPKVLTDGQREVAGNVQTQHITAQPSHGTRLLQIQEEEEDLSTDNLLTTDRDLVTQSSFQSESLQQTTKTAAFMRMSRYTTSPGHDACDTVTPGTNEEFKAEVRTNDAKVMGNVDAERYTIDNDVAEDQLDERRLEEEETMKSQTDGPPQNVRELSMTYDDYDEDLDNTDDEVEDKATSYYKTVCEQLGLAPVEFFIRNIGHRHIMLRFRGLGPDETKAIALSLRANVILERLDITGNYIGAEGARPVCRLLEENDYITDLILAENEIRSEGGLLVAKMIQVNAGLRRLDLSGNGLDDKCAEALSLALETNKHLREINLSFNNFTEVGAQFLGTAIGTNENLDVLNLSWNNLRERGGIEIAKGLKENVRLKTCNLSWNGLAGQGGLAITDAIAVNQSLIELDLSGNRLTFAVAAKMAKVLGTNDSIKILKMGNNLITSAGAIALASAINNTESCELQLLDLTDVPVDYEFQRTVDDVMMKRPNFKVIHGPVMRAGNTSEDLSKPAIDVDLIKKQPVVFLKEHIIVNDMRLIETLKRYDKGNTLSIAVDDFFTALEELAVPYDKIRLKESVLTFHGTKSGMIYFGSIISDDHRNVTSDEDVS